MHYTLAEAATATGKSKSTLLRSIQAGRISATRDELWGVWRVEPAELHRLYPALVHDAPDDTPRNGHDAGELDKWRALAIEREETIRDLRARLDAEAEERRRLTALLTDQRMAAAAPPPTGRWSRFLAWRRPR